MSQFQKLNDNINEILLSVIKNQELCKLIILSEPLNQPDIEDTSSLIFKNIFPLPKIPNLADSVTTYLSIYFTDFHLSRSNTGIKSGSITFDVICHIDHWNIEGTGMLRPLSILHEIDTMINHKRIIGLKKAEFNKCSPLLPDTSFAGFRVNYNIASGNT